MGSLKSVYNSNFNNNGADSNQKNERFSLEKNQVRNTHQTTSAKNKVVTNKDYEDCIKNPQKKQIILPVSYPSNTAVIVNFGLMSQNHKIQKSAIKFDRGMDFSYRFSKSAVAKRIIAAHGNGLEAIFEDEDLENEKTINTHFSHDFEQISAQGFRDRLEYSQLMRSQEEPGFSIGMEGSQKVLLFRDSKESLNLQKIPQEAFFEKSKPTHSSSEILISKASNISSNKKSSTPKVKFVHLEENYQNEDTVEMSDLKTEAKHIGELIKSPFSNKQSDVSLINSNFSSPNKNMIVQVNIAKIESSTPNRSGQRSKLSNCEDRYRTPIDSKIDEEKLKIVSRAGSEIKKLNFDQEICKSDNKIKSPGQSDLFFEIPTDKTVKISRQNVNDTDVLEIGRAHV